MGLEDRPIYRIFLEWRMPDEAVVASFTALLFPNTVPKAPMMMKRCEDGFQIFQADPKTKLSSHS